jgi:SAM-dependent methyltransferase
MSTSSRAVGRLAKVVGQERARRLRHRPRWGNLRRLEPFSRRYGVDRGTPVDRWYIQRFIDTHADDIRGHVVELADDRYASPRREAISELDILDIDSAHPRATIVADLAVPGALPHRAFDCAIVTQALQYVDSPATAVANLWESLAPGGVLLLTVPAIAKVDHDPAARDAWRVLPGGMEELVRPLAGAQAEVHGMGNLLGAMAFLLGLAAEELGEDELAVHDPLYPIVTCARVRRP